MTLRSVARRLMRLLLIQLVSLATLVASQAVNPPWELQTVDFGWNPYNDTLTQCRSLLLTWTPRPNVAGAPSPTPPYFMIWWLAGYEPYTLPLGAGSVSGGGGQYAWVVNLPTGGPYINSMIDSSGGTGGAGNIVNILAPTGSCQVQQLTPSSLDFVVPDAKPQCGTLQISVSGGTPPYTLHILPEDFPPKSVSYSTGTFSYVLDVKAGINTYLGVLDSTGKGAVAPSFAVASGSDSSCLTAAASLVPGSPQLTSVYPGSTVSSTATTGSSYATSSNTSSSTAGAGNAGVTSHSSKTPMIAGIAAAAGVLVLVIVAFILWKRRQSNSRPVVQNRPVDFDQPHVDPFYGAGAANRTAPGYNPAAGYHPNHDGPGMAEVGYGSAIAMNNMSPQSSNPRDSTASSYPSSGQALLDAQRNERKIDPTSAGAYHTRPLLPNSASSSAGFHTPDHSTTSTGFMPQYPVGFTVTNQEPSAWEQQEAAVRRTASPPLPPGAAQPNPIQVLGSQTTGFVGRSNTMASALERHKTPPPQYSPNQ